MLCSLRTWAWGRKRESALIYPQFYLTRRVIIFIMNIMKKINLVIVAVLFFAASWMTVYAGDPVSLIPYNASDVLGHVNLGTGDVQFDVLSQRNGQPAPNVYGFRYSSSIALDSANHRLFITDNADSRLDVFNLDSNNDLLDHAADNIINNGSGTA